MRLRTKLFMTIESVALVPALTVCGIAYAYLLSHPGVPLQTTLKSFQGTAFILATVVIASGLALVLTHALLRPSPTKSRRLS